MAAGKETAQSPKGWLAVSSGMNPACAQIQLGKAAGDLQSTDAGTTQVIQIRVWLSCVILGNPPPGLIFLVCKNTK